MNRPKTITEGLRNYFMDCPILDMDSPIYVDFKSPDPLSYTIDTLPGDPETRMYVDGGGMNEYNFSLNVTNEYNSNVFNQLDNIGFHEHLADWINEQNIKRNFPILPEGKQSVWIKATTGGYLYSSADKTAIYATQMKLVYRIN